VASCGALNHVCAPGGVVKTGASLRTLHSAVTGEEVATHAEGEAVGLVGAEEVRLLQLHHVDGGRVAVLVVQLALDLVCVVHAGVLAVLGHRVDLLEPLHLAVTKQGIFSQIKIWHRT